MKNPIIYFFIGTIALCYYAMASNDPEWSGNGHRCVGECYQEYIAQNGNLQEQLAAKQELLASASPADLGKNYYAQCIACHGAGGEGGVGPQLSGQSVDYVADRLAAYRAGDTVGNQSMLMWSVAKPMTDADITNLAAYISTL
jgi:cytochrome c553